MLLIRVRAAVVRTTIAVSCTSCKPVVQIEREIQVWQEIITAQGPVNSEVSEDLGETAGQGNHTITRFTCVRGGLSRATEVWTDGGARGSRVSVPRRRLAPRFPLLHVDNVPPHISLALSPPEALHRRPAPLVVAAHVAVPCVAVSSASTHLAQPVQHDESRESEPTVRRVNVECPEGTVSVCRHVGDELDLRTVSARPGGRHRDETRRVRESAREVRREVRDARGRQDLLQRSRESEGERERLVTERERPRGQERERERGGITHDRHVFFSSCSKVVAWRRIERFLDRDDRGACALGVERGVAPNSARRLALDSSDPLDNARPLIRDRADPDHCQRRPRPVSL